MKISHTCILCGKAEAANYTEDIRKKLIEKKYCHTCNFWDEHAERAEADPNYSLRVDCTHYIIGDEDASPHAFRGHAGAPFYILHNDGRVTKTTNLWYQGVIPPIFRQRMPDNARFIPPPVMHVYSEWHQAVLRADCDPGTHCYLCFNANEEWIVGFNIEVGDGSIVFRNEEFYFRERISGEDRRISTHEALMIAQQCCG